MRQVHRIFLAPYGSNEGLSVAEAVGLNGSIMPGDGGQTLINACTGRHGF